MFHGKKYNYQHRAMLSRLARTAGEPCFPEYRRNLYRTSTDASDSKSAGSSSLSNRTSIIYCELFGTKQGSLVLWTHICLLQAKSEKCFLILRYWSLSTMMWSLAWWKMILPPSAWIGAFCWRVPVMFPVILLSFICTKKRKVCKWNYLFASLARRRRRVSPP